MRRAGAAQSLAEFSIDAYCQQGLPTGFLEQKK